MLPCLFYYYFESTNSLLVGLIIGSALPIIALYFYQKDYKFNFIYIKDNLKKYYQYSYPTILISFFSMGILYSDRFFIEYFLPTYELGIYALLIQVAGFSSILSQVYGNYVNPLILKTYEESKYKAIKSLNYYILLFAAIIYIGILILFIMPTKLFIILLRPDIIYNDYYYTTFFILIFSSSFAILQNAFALYYVLSKNLNIIIYFYLIGFIINIFGNFFIKDYGIMAAAVSTLTSYFVILVLHIYFRSR
jgi:O-antigen/teichoic acid export membrane protein